MALSPGGGLHYFCKFIAFLFIPDFKVLDNIIVPSCCVPKIIPNSSVGSLLLRYLRKVSIWKFETGYCFFDSLSLLVFSF